jgi:hypothetical protein
MCMQISKRLSAITAMALAAAASGCAGTRTLTDESVLEYASAPYTKGGPAPQEVLGLLNDVPVVVDFVCSDLCPISTVRIIHFDVEPGERCAAVGGQVMSMTVPVAITVMQKDFCFPAVLARNWSAYVK